MKKLIRIIVPVLLAALVVFSIGWFLFEYDRDFTRDLLLREARLNDMRGNTSLSAWFYKMAYSHSGNDEAVAIELANQYKSEQNYTKAEVTLSKAINSRPSAALYAALCRTFVEQDKLMDAVALLAGIPDAAVKEEVERLRPTAPTAAQDPGFYNQYTNVELRSSSGTIYYTTNGEYPSVRQDQYSAPIKLGAGETIIYSISVDNSGLVSPVSVLGYTVGGVVEPAVFMDAEMEFAIRDKLGVNRSDVLYTNDLWEITDFTVPPQIRTLEDLSKLPHLQELTIHDLELSTLNDIAALTELQSLDLSGCRFPASELASLAKIPTLNKLILADCGLSTIADLQPISTLSYLDISNNTVRNLEPISGMENMRELYMQHNAVTALDSLTFMYNLEKLDVSFNALSSLIPLGVCSRLTWLDVSSNQLTNVNGLAALPLLTSLSLNYNQISDISPLGACIQIKELSFNNNRVYNMENLASLVNLEVLDFSYNSISIMPAWPQNAALRVIQGSYNTVSNINSLGGLSGLTYVSMDYNNITDVTALANCANLVQVNIYGNSISNVTPLTEHSIIVNYDPT